MPTDIGLERLTSPRGVVELESRDARFIEVDPQPHIDTGVKQAGRQAAAPAEEIDADRSAHSGSPSTSIEAMSSLNSSRGCSTALRSRVAWVSRINFRCCDERFNR